MSMSEAEPTSVSVSRRIEADADEIFAVLTDPTRHPGIDGSGMLRYAVTRSTVTGTGQSFVIRMHNDEMGEYEMTNTVVEFEPSRRIAWAPAMSAGTRDEDVESLSETGQHVWGFSLEPDGAATLVTETFDCSNSPPWLRRAVRGGTRWQSAMEATLERLDQQCSARLRR
ncbi:MAG: SRPBCC family protein [Acidobacteriota bacterium]|nr:SRPBCC family protein [Acidobacteriota bacterium]